MVETVVLLVLVDCLKLVRLEERMFQFDVMKKNVSCFALFDGGLIVCVTVEQS